GFGTRIISGESAPFADGGGLVAAFGEGDALAQLGERRLGIIRVLLDQIAEEVDGLVVLMLVQIGRAEKIGCIRHLGVGGIGADEARQLGLGVGAVVLEIGQRLLIDLGGWAGGRR